MAADTKPNLTGALPADPALPQMARQATTASMQSLLAEYFETQHFDPVRAPSPPFESVRPHTLAGSQSETRHRPVGQPIAALAPAIEAAFIPTVAAPPPAAPAPAQPEPRDSWPLSAIALIDSLMAENERLRSELQAQTLATQFAETQADSDVLTPTLNRRAFLREMQRAMADCKRYGEEACLIFLDMDGFKGINDTYGHAAGDAALIYVADTLRCSVREGDSVGRIGGDEFAILLRRADLNSSRIKALKLEAELALGTFEHRGLYLKTGGSFGVRAFAGQTSAEAWLSEADAAMFLVKKSSR
ncbi:MAG TPA: GGDEF domain-containing protein [Asticcacaulis sp.]|nr:GGDEF domain-containing protein [Asticcacaulis sp.]